MTEPKKPLGGAGPQEIHEVQPTIHDFFDPKFFEFQWWEKGALERKSRIILIGRLETHPPKKKEEEEEEDEEGKNRLAKEEGDEDESTQMIHRMLHRLPDYCNHHTVVLLSESAERELCKAAARLPRLFVLDPSAGWILPTMEQFSLWIQIASSDPLKREPLTQPLLSHSNWTIS